MPASTDGGGRMATSRPPRRAGRARHPRPRLDRAQLRTAWQVVSLLLDYPTPELLDQRATLARAAAGLPTDLREPISAFLAHLHDESLDELQRDYVQTFDLTRRCCLYLTYFAHGDTRKRGLALVRFTTAYRSSGVTLEAAELPDHLGVVLEFGAAYDPDEAWDLLNDHRAGIEMLRIALAERESPWHHVVVALVATLPPLKGDDEQRMWALVAQGPPTEEVGLELHPYALDPSLTASTAQPSRPGSGGPAGRSVVDLGATITVGAP